MIIYIYIEFKNFEIRDEFIKNLKSKGFETSLNSYGTLVVEVGLVRFNSLDSNLVLEDKKKVSFVNIQSKDFNYFEVQI